MVLYTVLKNTLSSFTPVLPSSFFIMEVLNPWNLTFICENTQGNTDAWEGERGQLEQSDR